MVRRLATVDTDDGVLEPHFNVPEESLPERLNPEELEARFAFKDKGERLMSALDLKIGDLKLGIAGDSTANAADEWADLLLVKLGTRYPSRTITIPHWNDGTQLYNAPTAVQTGTMPSGVVVLDTFTRSGELYASQPDTGSAWGRDGSNAMGDLLMDGTAAVSTSDATAGVYVQNVPEGNHKTSANITMSTLTRGSSSAWAMLRLMKDYASNYILLNMTVTTAGTPQFNIIKRINGVQVASTLTTATSLAVNTAAVTFDASLERIGNTITATVGATTITVVLTEAEVAFLAGSGIAAIGKSPVAGDKYNEYKVELTGAVAPSLTFYNASMSGSKLDYQQTRLAALYPVPLDLLFISAGHNYGVDTPDVFLTKLESFITDFRAVQPTAGIIITSQNPQKAPASNRVAHLQRQAVLRSYAASRGYGYLAVIETWMKQAGDGESLVLSDGVHPTPGGTASGSSLWRDVAYDYLLERSV